VNLNTKKETLRKEIAATKSQYTKDELLLRSEEVFSVLEITGIFEQASGICIYNAMNDEVATHSFINKWQGKKDFYLPVVEGVQMVLRKIERSTVFQKSPLGVLEPVGNNFTDYRKINLVIVPGIAFDRQRNRLGRGGGYYDRFLPNIKASKIGVCFDFQLLDNIPTDEWDMKMDMVISENELIW
jgi:5-formyltetrahydrofolate cyclo-ligase